MSKEHDQIFKTLKKAKASIKEVQKSLEKTQNNFSSKKQPKLKSSDKYKNRTYLNSDLHKNDFKKKNLKTKNLTAKTPLNKQKQKQTT